MNEIIYLSLILAAYIGFGWLSNKAIDLIIKDWFRDNTEDQEVQVHHESKRCN